MIGEPLRERLRSLERGDLVALLLVGFLVVGAGAFWYVRSLPSPVSVQLTGGAEASGRGGGAVSSPSPSPALVVVHVTGWVRRPGVYELLEGDRIIDAIRRAGGARHGADLSSLNMAALLVDAQQIVLLKKGRGPLSGASSAILYGAPEGEGPIDINTATVDQLETLPGIGPTLAQRIIDHREEHGPFRSVDELLDVSGIGDQRLADIRSKVTV